MNKEEIIKELADGLNMTYGKPNTVELPDGRLLRAECRPDSDSSITDCDEDCYGKVAHIHNNYQPKRPDGFDGSARKIWNQSECFWWQPPKGLAAEHLPKLQSLVQDLLSFGFSGIVVEVCQGKDAYHKPIVTDVADLWGIDEVSDEYGAEVVADLLHDLGVFES